MNDPKLITLGNLNDGAAEELFQGALQNVLDNMADINTDAKAKRRIVLTITLSTDDERKTAKVDVGCSTKLAGIKPVSTHVFIGLHEGRMAAVEALKQEDLFPKPHAAGPSGLVENAAAQGGSAT